MWEMKFHVKYTHRNGYMRAVSARQLSVKREKLLEWNKILCSVITAQNNSITFRMPSCWNNMLTHVPVCGKVGDKGG